MSEPSPSSSPPLKLTLRLGESEPDAKDTKKRSSVRAQEQGRKKASAAAAAKAEAADGEKRKRDTDTAAAKRKKKKAPAASAPKTKKEKAQDKSAEKLPDKDKEDSVYAPAHSAAAKRSDVDYDPLDPEAATARIIEAGRGLPRTKAQSAAVRAVYEARTPSELFAAMASMKAAGLDPPAVVTPDKYKDGTTTMSPTIDWPVTVLAPPKISTNFISTTPLEPKSAKPRHWESRPKLLPTMSGFNLRLRMTEGMQHSPYAETRRQPKSLDASTQSTPTKQPTIAKLRIPLGLLQGNSPAGSENTSPDRSLPPESQVPTPQSELQQ